MSSECFARQRECRFYTAGCVNKIAVSVTRPRAVNQLGGPVITGYYRRIINSETTSRLNSAQCRPYVAVNVQFG